MVSSQTQEKQNWLNVSRPEKTLEGPYFDQIGTYKEILHQTSKMP
jgi:hypothetical protein